MDKGDRVKMMSNGTLHSVDRIGVFKPQMENVDCLYSGEIGFITASIKQVRDTRVGDTITHDKRVTATALPGFKPSQPVVFCGLFPVDSSQFEDLRDAIEKLALNDASFSSEMETSAALGFGFRCGFLGMLHMEIIQERLEREHDLDLITTSPTVVYEIENKGGEIEEVENPSKFPDPASIEKIREPIARAAVLTPETYVGNVIELCVEKRGVQKSLRYVGGQIELVYDLPMNLSLIHI